MQISNTLHHFRRYLLYCGIVVLFSGLTTPVSAAYNNQESIPIIITVFEDVQSSTLAKDILDSPASFQFNTFQDQINFGVSRSTFWFKVDIPAQRKTQKTVLEISYPLLDIVDIYTSKNKNWSLLEVGDTRPVANREIDHYNFLKTIELDGGQSQQVFIKTRTHGPTIVPIKLWKLPAFHVHDRNNTLLMGLYFGLLFAIIIYNLFLYLSVRDNSYLYYIGYLSSLVLFIFTLAGLVAYYLLPDLPLVTSRLPFISLCLALLFGFKFSSNLNNTNELAPGLVKTFNIFSWLLFSIVFVGLFIGVRFLSLVTPYFAILAFGLYIYAIVVGIRADYKPSYFVAFTFLVVIPGGVFYALKPFGLTGNAGWLNHAFQSSVVIDSLLLSFALAYRIRYSQNQLEKTRRKTARAHADFSKQLITSLDQERRLLATDLHDGLGQDLLVIKNKLIRAIKPEKQTEKNVIAAHQILQTTIDDIRHLSHRLHPHVLDRLGLKDAAIAVLNDAFNNRDIDLDYAIEEIKFPKNNALALHLYRIIQEGVKNIILHASASRVHIEIHLSSNHIHLLIEDFPKDVKQKWADTIDFSKNFGLSSIRERAELLMGRCEFSHNDSGGFKIDITVPFFQ